MSSRRAAALRAIATIATAFGAVKERIVLVGGTVAALYPNEQSVDIRPTIVVDCIVHVATTIEYYAFLDLLRARDFAHCTDEGAPMCRLVYEDIRVDVMPSADTAVGPTNRWYAEAMREAAEYEVVAGVRVRAITPLYFIARSSRLFARAAHRPDRCAALVHRLPRLDHRLRVPERDEPRVQQPAGA